MDIPGNQFYTDQYVILAHGKAEKEWPFTFCSDSKIAESEFERWKKQLVVDGLSVPSRSICNTKCEKINKLILHRFTSDELNEKLEKQRKYRHLLTQSQPKPSAKTNSSSEQANNLRLLNEKNRRQNAENVRKALVAEKNRQRAAARAKAAELAAASKNETLAVPKNEIDSLFSEGEISRTATPVQNTSATKPTTPKETTKGGIPTFTKMSMDDDIIGTMDLGIDIEI